MVATGGASGAGYELECGRGLEARAAGSETRAGSRAKPRSGPWKDSGLGMERMTSSRERSGGAGSGRPDPGYPGQMAEAPTLLSDKDNRVGIQTLPVGRTALSSLLPHSGPQFSHV